MPAQIYGVVTILTGSRRSHDSTMDTDQAAPRGLQNSAAMTFSLCKSMVLRLCNIDHIFPCGGHPPLPQFLGDGLGAASSCGRSDSDCACNGNSGLDPPQGNLLNPDYNVAGFAVVRNRNMIYVTQDFAHGLPSR